MHRSARTSSFIMLFLSAASFAAAFVGCGDGEETKPKTTTTTGAGGQGGVGQGGDNPGGMGGQGGEGGAAAVCGDGVIGGGEACDDGNVDPGDGCDSNCAFEPGYPPVCGDGITVIGEDCDDQNTDAGDGCDSVCAVEAGYECSGEPSVCVTVCGDGLIVNAEACDDGNVDPADGCDSVCAVETGYECSGEPSVCGPVCGDGMMVGGEGCDDGNTSAADGCDANCTIEAGWVCAGEPSVCCSPQPEICDGFDNDCNGVPDEGCNCIDGQTQNCYTGPPGTQNVGICKGGTQTCVNGNFGACVGQVLPQIEVCDGIDQNCDGQNDNGVGCVCTPNSTMSCYSGPPGTQGVGICKAGTQTCAADGKSWGACTGQVLPSPENCSTPADDDCNGMALACNGSHLYSKGFGDASSQQGMALAVDAMGNVYVTGHFDGTVDFGNGALTSAGGLDVFVAKYTNAGVLVWAKRYGSAGDQIGTGIGVDGAGNAYVTGNFTGDIDFGMGVLTSAGGDDIFVAKLDSAGNALYSVRYGNTVTQNSEGIAVDAAGNAVVAGHYSGTVTIGGTQLMNQGNLDIMLFKLSNTGTPTWAKGFGANNNQQAFAVALDSVGNVLVTGSIENTTDFGGGVLTAAGGRDIFVAKFNGQGTHQWSKIFGDGGNQRALAVAADPSGNVLVTGEYAGAVNFGGTAFTSQGLDDGFVVKFDPAGTHVWSKSFGVASAQRGKGIASDTFGNVLLTGEYFSSVDFGGGPVNAVAVQDIFVAKLNPAGTQIWVKSYGTTLADRGEAIATDPSANVWVTGTFIGNIDFGGGAITGSGAEDMFLLKLAQ